MRSPTRAWVTGAVALAVLAGCSGGSDDSQSTPGTTTATTASDGTTVPGTELKLGKTAVVDFAADKKHQSQVKLTVTKVRKGSIKDLDRFELSDKARKSGVYYVSAKVKNLGPDKLAGATVTLFGKVSDDLVVPPVTLGSTFPLCNYTALPKKFGKGDSAKTCMVMLAPKHGKVSEVQWRGPDQPLPISWPVH